MIHAYYGVYDRAAKCYVHICESKNDETMARMCAVLAKDDKTFIGQAPEDFKAYKLADFDEDSGKFTSIEPVKVWEGKPNE